MSYIAMPWSTISFFNISEDFKNFSVSQIYINIVIAIAFQDCHN